VTEGEALDRMRTTLRDDHLAQRVIVSVIHDLRYLARDLGASEERIRAAVDRAVERANS
jgi:DNA-binding transcriptional regulator PaaX